MQKLILILSFLLIGLSVNASQWTSYEYDTSGSQDYVCPGDNSSNIQKTYYFKNGKQYYKSNASTKMNDEPARKINYKSYDDLSEQQKAEFERERQEYLIRQNAKYANNARYYNTLSPLFNTVISGATQTQSAKSFLQNNASSLLYTIFKY